MERAVQLNLLNRVVLVVFCTYTAGCSQPARKLPLDYGSVNSNIRIEESQFSNEDLALTCSLIDEEMAELRNQSAAIESQIIASRGSDQGLGFAASVIFPPLWLAIDNDEEYKVLMARVHERIDTLTGLRRVKSCQKNSPSSEDASDFEQELEQLVDLREKDVISSEEFLELRSRVFNKYYLQN
jgi:hypothetical protein